MKMEWVDTGEGDTKQQQQDFWNRILRQL
jgi:hypothetical protein